MTTAVGSNSYTVGASAPPIWARPDPALAAAGIEGEFVVARVRLLAMALLMIAPTWNITHQPDVPIHRTGFAVTLAASIAALAIYLMLRRGRWRPWIGFASSALDVSMVSTALVTFLIVGSPLIALNSKVTFEMYFLAVVAASLRYDGRVCLVAGALALGEYGGLWAYAATHYDLYDPIYTRDSGPYSPVDLRPGSSCSGSPPSWPSRSSAGPSGCCISRRATVSPGCTIGATSTGRSARRWRARRAAASRCPWRSSISITSNRSTTCTATRWAIGRSAGWRSC